MAPTTCVCAKCEKVYSNKNSLYKHLYGYVDHGKRMPAMCPVPDGEFFRGGRCAVLRSDFKRDITKREFDKEVAFTHSTRYPRPSDDEEPSQVAEDTVRSEDYSLYQAPTDDDIEETIYRMFERGEQAGKNAPPQYLPFVKNAAGSWEQVTHERMQKAWSVIFVYRMREEFPELVPMPARPVKSKR